MTLLAALNDLTGKILAERAPRHRHQGWLKFLTTIDSSTPSKVDLHLILDNDANHKQHKVMRWLAAHPRFHRYFTPTSASWLNLVERFFRNLSQDVIFSGSFGSTHELVDAIWGDLAERSGSADMALSEKSPYPRRCVGKAEFVAGIQDVAR